MIYVTNPSNKSISYWSNENVTSNGIMFNNSIESYGIFVDTNDDIYIDNGYSNGEVNQWSNQLNKSIVIMNVNGICYDLFIDMNETLYCSLGDDHQVIKRSLNENINDSIICAGTGINGSSLNELNSPRGICVDNQLNLYIADCKNNRIQLFEKDQLNGQTISLNSPGGGLLRLDCPTDVILDADGYLFIVDQNNNRILGSNSDGYRCVIGCFHSNVSSELSFPQSISFDSYGNIFVVDSANNRIEKYFLLSDLCGNLTIIQIRKSFQIFS